MNFGFVSHDTVLDFKYVDLDIFTNQKCKTCATYNYFDPIYAKISSMPKVCTVGSEPLLFTHFTYRLYMKSYFEKRL